jgi:hypothetical protein
MVGAGAVDIPFELPPPHEASRIARHAIEHDAVIPRT